MRSLFISTFLFISLLSSGQSAERYNLPIDPDSVSASGPSRLDAVANVFTPNNDGVNDVFVLSGAGIQDIALVIYDRWGTKVYEFISRNDHWDGHTTSGIECSSGVYFYFLKASGVDGASYSSNGTVQLLR